MLFFLQQLCVGPQTYCRCVAYTECYNLVPSTENNAPKFLTRDVSLPVIAGMSYSYITSVVATDIDLDSISYSLADTAPKGVDIDPVSGAISWSSVQDDKAGNIEVIAFDGTANSVLGLTIKLCKCQV